MKRRLKGQQNKLEPVIKKPYTGSDQSLPALRDPLRAYIQQITKYPVLNKKEEEVLVKKMQNGDIEAAKLLVLSNLRLVIKIAFEYKNTYQNIMDLIQEGNIGLMKAISMYDSSKGTKLSYYASWWIRSYILKFLIDNFRLVKLGTTQAQKRLFYNLLQEQKRIESQGTLALPETIGANLAVKGKEVEEMTTRLTGDAEISFDQPISSGDDKRTFIDTYQDNSMRPDTIVEDHENKVLLRQRLNDFAQTLNEKERTILKDRLLSETPHTLQEIADKFDISKERARQLEERILKRIKTELKEFAT
jgi:RNA polymerase sigma-32 factor